MSFENSFEIKSIVDSFISIDYFICITIIFYCSIQVTFCINSIVFYYNPTILITKFKHRF